MLPQSTIFIKKENQKKIKNTIKTLGVATKKDVATLTGLSFSTCNNLINELVETRELLILKDVMPNDMGRPSYAYEINTMHTLILCVVIEEIEHKTSLSLFLMDVYGEHLNKQTYFYENLKSRDIVKVIHSIVKEHQNIGIIGLSVPGIVVENGEILQCLCNNLNHQNLSEMIFREFGIPTISENDMNLIVYGIDSDANYSELGSVVAISDFKDSLQGAGIVVNGKILKGYTNFAGEISFLPKLSKSNMEYLAFQIVCFATIINPNLVAIYGNQLKKEELPKLLNYIQTYIPREHCPEIEILNSNTELINGLLRLCLQQMYDS